MKHPSTEADVFPRDLTSFQRKHEESARGICITKCSQCSSVDHRPIDKARLFFKTSRVMGTDEVGPRL